MVVEQDVTATAGYLYLDGDYENAATNDSVNDVQFADNLVLTAKTLMTFESTAGKLAPAGRLTLLAGSGLVLLDDMTSTTPDRTLVMDVDLRVRAMAHSQFGRARLLLATRAT